MANEGRRRTPVGRVRVTYALPGGRGQGELPFVVGVLGDFAGRSKTVPKLRDRKFIEVSEQNFDAVLAAMTPRLECTVENRLSGDDSGMRVELTFRSLKDFEPEQIARQVEPLRRLVELRERLQALRAAVHRRRAAGAGRTEGGNGGNG